MARRSGADAVVEPLEGHVVEQVAAIVGAGPRAHTTAADVVFECAGVPAAFAEALQLVRRGGTVAVTALYEERATIDPSAIVWKELRIVGTFAYREEFPQAIELLRSGKVRTAPLVTDHVSLDDTDAGFERQLARDQAMKVMIHPPGSRSA